MKKILLLSFILLSVNLVYGQSGYLGDGLGSYKLQRELRGNLQNIVDLTHISYDTGIASGPVIFKNRADFDSFVGHWGDPNNYWVLSTDEQKWVIGGLTGMNFIEGDIDYAYFGDSDWDYLIIGDTTTAGVVWVATYTYSTHDWHFPHNVIITEQGEMEHLLVKSTWATTGAGILQAITVTAAGAGGTVDITANDIGSAFNQNLRLAPNGTGDLLLQLDANSPAYIGTAGVSMSTITTTLASWDQTHDFTKGVKVSTLTVVGKSYFDDDIDATDHKIIASSFSLVGSGIKATIHYDVDQHAILFSTRTVINGGLTVNGDFDGNGNCIEDVCTLTVSSGSEFVGEHHDFAEISITTGTTATALTNQNVWYQIITLISTVGVRGLTVGGNEIIISTEGWYNVLCPVSFSGTIKDKTIEFGILKNNGSYGTGDGNLEHLRAVQLTNGANTYQAVPIMGKAYFNVGDHVELWARCTCSDSNSVTVRHGVLDVDKR